MGDDAVDSELLRAVRALSVASPNMGVKKMTQAVKSELSPGTICGSKQVRQALGVVKKELEESSPAVTPSASPEKADAVTVGTKSEPALSVRQQKIRLQKQAVLEEQARAKRKTAAFKKLFPELNLQIAFGANVDRRLQRKELGKIQEKLTDQAYLANAITKGGLSATELSELLQDIRSGGFTPTASDLDDDESGSAAEGDDVAQTSEAAASAMDLPSFGNQASLGLPSFGNQN